MYAGISMVIFSVSITAFAQNSVPHQLDISIENLEPHPAGLTPQTLLVRVADGQLSVGDVRLVLELVGAPDSAYCTCGQATTDDSGTFELTWGSLNPSASTLRITARADGYDETIKEFVLNAIDTDLELPDSVDIDLWIPSSMLENQHYEGVIITEKAYPQGSKVLLTSSNPSSIGVDQETFILPGENHAIFSIYPKIAISDTVNIFASIDGPLFSAESRVYSQQSVPSKLELIFPSNKTMTDSVTTYVFIVDKNGAPAHASFDTKISLEAGRALDFPNTLTIPSGNFYSSFSTTVFGDDVLWAHADGLESASASIEKILHNATLQIGITPDPAGPNSYAKYYVWLLVDGLPYSPPGIRIGQIHTNNTSIAGFKTAGLVNSESDTLYMKNGIVNGTLYTRNAGVVSITASFPDIGTITSSIIVGPQLTHNDERISVPTCSNTHGSDHVINSIDVWVYPNVTNRHALLSVAPYHETTANSACLENILDADYSSCTSSATRSGCGSIKYPMEVDNRQVSLSVSPSGVEYDKIVELTQHTLRSFFTEFELVIQDVGDYVINATGTNVLPASNSFTNPKNSQKYYLHITPLFVDANDTIQDVALVSIVDSKGTLVDAKHALGRPAKVTITGQNIDDTTVIIGTDSAKFRANLNAGTTITATTPNLTRAISEIPLPKIPSRIALDIPESVHLHEEFPFAIHTMDSTGTLIGTGQEIELAANGITTDWESYRMNANLVGNLTMSILTDYGADQKSIDVFANTLNMRIRESGATARVGTPFRIDVLASDDIEINVSTSITWQIVEGTTSIDVTSDVPGTFPVTITGSTLGYAPESQTIYVTVEDYTLLDITATGTDKMNLELTKVSLSLNMHDSEEQTSDIVLPWRREYKNLASVELIFPHSHNADNGYVFSSVTVNGHKYEQNVVNISVYGDTNIHAVYERSIIINVEGDHDILGIGHYAYGQNVELVAQTKSKLAFLIFEVFEYWENIPDDADVDNETVRFRAIENADLIAVYRDDYTGILLVLIITMISIVALKYYRRHSRTTLRWTLGELYRTIYSQLAKYQENIAQRRPRKTKHTTQ